MLSEAKQLVPIVFEGLYSEEIIDQLILLTKYYLEYKSHNPNHTIPLPESLKDVTSAREMSNPKLVRPDFLNHQIFEHLGIAKEDNVYGPLNAILTRMITIPRMLHDYAFDAYPSEEERAIYTDPPLLQLSQDDLRNIYKNIFAQASEKLQDPKKRLEVFKALGALGEIVAQKEKVYPGKGSTQAYETFGIWHLLPGNTIVDITSTSPGVILPTEADPLRFKDTHLTLKKNLLRPTYFEMLKRAVDLDTGRARRYFASERGTAENLQAYPKLLPIAKEIFEQYLALGPDVFEIRLGDPSSRMKLTTLIGDQGTVYSVRDKEEKGKIAHNVTVWDPEEASKHRKHFEEMWKEARPIDSTNVIDELFNMEL